MERLEYLQLEIPQHFQRQTINNLQNIKIHCNYSTSSYSHEIHGENSQLNLITDLLINMSRQHNYISNTLFTQINTLLQEKHKSKQEHSTSQNQNITYMVRMIDEIYSIVKRKNDIHIYLQDLKIQLTTTLSKIENQMQQITQDTNKLLELSENIKTIVLS